MARLTRFLLYAIIISVIAIIPLISLYGEWLWFSSVGFGSVFLTMLYTKLGLGITLGVVFFAVLYLNMHFVNRSLPKKGKKLPWLPVILVLSFFIATIFSNGWETALMFLNGTEFRTTDPVFSNDVKFYVFELPFYSFMLAFITVLTVFALLSIFLGHVLYSVRREKLETDEEGQFMRAVKVDWFPKGKGLSQLYFWFGLLFLAFVAWFFLARFNILFSESGAVAGAGFTDLTVQLPFLTVMSILSAIIAVIFFLNMKVLKRRLLKMSIIAFIAALILGNALGIVVQQFVVKPDEFNKEKAYIERSIGFTLNAFNLKDVDEKPLALSTDLSRDDISNNKGTIENIRILDWRPLLRTNNQLQVFRTYYDFQDVDIDRYFVDGEYKQVMISPREMNINNLAPQARTWVNRHLVYTHGYGVTMSPVERISKEGLPTYFIKDIPPQSDFFVIERPEIYFGQQTVEFIVVNTKTEELDYPKGETNIYTTYAGRAGIKLTGINRFVYAIMFGSPELLVSESITPDSKILFNRKIEDRIRAIAPFLKYDSDPYIVVSDGRLFWLYDAYTTTDKYPYSQPVSTTGGDINYIRNSVKVLIDAYNGDVTFYVIDKEDPLINTYRKIFPGAFKDFSEMNDDLKRHIRYPEDLFRMQAAVYSLYHMKNPRVFYNSEDTWAIPQEIYRGTKQDVTPYYVIMKLPEKEREEFLLMTPFTPLGKDNMIGWMAASSDEPSYGKITVFTFSKQELTFGPLQIEARINQDTTISQQLTLWDQAGSEVVRGNLLAIPIENSILYVEPLYLQASEGAVPELKRVIVVFGDRLTMQETLEQALDVLFGEAAEELVEKPAGKTTEQLIKEANELYIKAQDALKQGNLTKYADYIDQVGRILAQLQA